MFKTIARHYRIDVTFAIILITAVTLLTPVPKTGEPWLLDLAQVAMGTACFLWWRIHGPAPFFRCAMPVALLLVSGEALTLLVTLAKSVDTFDIQCPAYLLTFWVAERTVWLVSRQVRNLWVAA